MGSSSQVEPASPRPGRPGLLQEAFDEVEVGGRAESMAAASMRWRMNANRTVYFLMALFYMIWAQIRGRAE